MVERQGQLASRMARVAGRIETAAQVDGLLELGCSVGQGWLFAPSMSDADLASYLAKRSGGSAPEPR